MLGRDISELTTFVGHSKALNIFRLKQERRGDRHLQEKRQSTPETIRKLRTRARRFEAAAAILPLVSVQRSQRLLRPLSKSQKGRSDSGHGRTHMGAWQEIAYRNYAACISLYHRRTGCFIFCCNWRRP